MTILRNLKSLESAISQNDLVKAKEIVLRMREEEICKQVVEVALAGVL
jgi:hypothetical protein